MLQKSFLPSISANLREIATQVKQKFLFYLPLLVILVIAGGLRWCNLNWDQGTHLHPDERFLTMVQLDLKLPQSFSEYLDPNRSTLNPQNQGHAFYVYGMLPLTVNKILAHFNHSDTYDLAHLQGRFLSGLADVGTTLLIYLLGQLIIGGGRPKPSHEQKSLARQVGLWAAALYAVAVLPIQLSHFFAADSFLVFFVMASIWASWRYLFSPSQPWKKIRHLIQAGIFFGCALACKLSAIFALPLVCLAILLAAFRKEEKLPWKFTAKKIVAASSQIFLAFSILFVALYCATRIASPNYFADTNWLNVHLNPRFAQSIESLKSYEDENGWFPPAIQWINKPPIWFSLKNLSVYGVGLPWFGLMVIGTLYIGLQLWKHWRQKEWTVSDWIWAGLLIWTAAFFTYQSSQFVKVMRYFNVLYPILALLAGWGITRAIIWIDKLSKNRSTGLSIGLFSSLIGVVLIWPLAFMSIYLHPHSRVSASNWLNQNLPNNSHILNEYWDDPLPVFLPTDRTFIGEQISVFDPDTPEKWVQLHQSFSSTSYYILSSNRTWGSIMALPDKYPEMSEYYRRLLAGQTEWQLIKTFTSYPSLRYLGIPIDFNTDGADEAFTVYDHPKVLIFSKNYHTGSLMGTQSLFTRAEE